MARGGERRREPNMVRYYGPVGSEEFYAWREDAKTRKQGYRSFEGTVAVPHQVAAAADPSEELFKPFKRPHPWKILEVEGQEFLLIFPNIKQIRQKIALYKGKRREYRPSFKTRVYDLADLEKEEFSPHIVTATESAFGTERYLGSFAEALARISKGGGGFEKAGYQWTGEESEHSVGLEAMLLRVGGRGEGRRPVRTVAQLKELEKHISQHEWDMPFTTPRQMTIYAYFQEHFTERTYQKIRANIIHNAPKIRGSQRIPLSAILYGITAADEGQHKKWYKAGTQLYAHLDPIGTAEDVYWVAEHFQMPADLLLPNPRKRFSAYARSIGVSPEAFARGLYNLMMDLNIKGSPPDFIRGIPEIKELQFIDEERARKIACIYASKGDRSKWNLSKEDFAKLIASPRSALLI